MLGTIAFLSLAGLVGYAKYDRNKKFSKPCPKCGRICKPHTTGTMDGRTHLTNYKYKCNCGCQFS